MLTDSEPGGGGGLPFFFCLFPLWLKLADSTPEWRIPDILHQSWDFYWLSQSMRSLKLIIILSNSLSFEMSYRVTSYLIKSKEFSV